MNAKTTRTPVLRSEDWWACFIGWVIVLIAILGQAMFKMPEEKQKELDAQDQAIAALKTQVADAKAKGKDGAVELKALNLKLNKAAEKRLKTEKSLRSKEYILPQLPKMGTWKSIDEIYKVGWFVPLLGVFAFVLILTMISGIWLKFDLKLYAFGFIVIFALGMLADVVGHQHFIKKTLQLSPVLFALLFGLLISNLLTVPKWLVAARQTEYFVKIGLVAMGAGIIFGDVIRAGVVGIAQALLVATVVWFMTYWICRKFRVSERFSAIIATANSICGVSATIAAGGAIQGDSKEVSYMVAWVLVCAVILIFVLPPIAVALELPPAWAGAWVGGVIDNTGAVVAAGESIAASLPADEAEAGKDVAVAAASIVKMAQNVLIGFAAFFMALWATLSLEKKEAAAAGQAARKVGFGEVWYRFPKFVVGFVVASVVVSFFVAGGISEAAASAVGGHCKTYRNLLFGLCFVAIGLETNIKELVSVGGGRPAIAYWLAQTANAFWTLFITWLLWSGVLFEPVL